jgi:hypothetical protein
MSPDSDEQLVRYLLGDVPDAEADRLDERSITDDAFAVRLRVIENDLVDKYARGEPFDASLERFDRLYRASSHLREKVRFAQALHQITSKSAADREPVRTPPAPSRSGWWSLAAAAVLLLAVAGYLGIRNMTLRDELGQLEARRAAAERQNAQLQQQLERTPTTPPPPLTPVTATFLLRPPRRGIGNDATIISIPQGTGQVMLRLQVESDSYTAFWAALRDPATARIVWRSADLTAASSAGEQIVTLTIPASAFRAQRYSVELTGMAADGATEVIGHYTVQVVLE